MSSVIPFAARVVRDSFANFMSGLGIAGRDKSTGATYTFTPISMAEVEAAYRSDWIARKIVNIPAQDATREWRAWQAEGNDIEKLEEAERALELQKKLRCALILSRLYGGAALIMGVDQGSSEKELDVERVGLGALKFLRVVSRLNIHAGEIITDPMDPYFGEPEYYETQATGTNPSTRIHPSRVVRLVGDRLESSSLGYQGPWGDSVLQPVLDAVKDTTTVIRTIATLVHDSKVDIVKIPDMTDNMPNQDYRDLLSTRFVQANVLKSAINTIVLDKEEEWQRISTDFGALPAVMQMFFLVVSGGADVPATRMLGQSPAGMSSTGESDIRNYYDRIADNQENDLKPALSRLDEVLIRHALGKRDPSIYYEWNPLWQSDELQDAQIFKMKAEIYKIDADVGLMDQEALRIGRQNQLVEDGLYPGLETALEQQQMLGEESMVSPEETAAKAAEEAKAAAEALKAQEVPAGGPPGVPGSPPAPGSPAA